jgi:hypothetical protein
LERLGPKPTSPKVDREEDQAHPVKPTQQQSEETTHKRTGDEWHSPLRNRHVCVQFGLVLRACVQLAHLLRARLTARRLFACGVRINSMQVEQGVRRMVQEHQSGPVRRGSDPAQSAVRTQRHLRNPRGGGGLATSPA